MIDIHCHILPGLDDGAADIAGAEAMLKAAAGDGVTTIFCTPHDSAAALGQRRKKREELAPVAGKYGITLLDGMEYLFSHLTTDSELCTLAESSFLLVDFGSPELPPAAQQVLFKLARRNYRIIAAHPERLFGRLEPVEALYRLGCCFQVNADSLLGNNGRRCRGLAERMIRRGLCHYVASDAHGAERTFRLTECRKRLAELTGDENAELLLETNPRRLIDDLPPRRPAVKDTPAIAEWFRFFRKKF